MEKKFVNHLLLSEIHPIASSRFLLSTTEGVTEGVITTRSNRMKFRLASVCCVCSLLPST